MVFDDLKNNATLTAMLVYLASEDPVRVSRVRREILTDRIDLARLTETTTIETQLVPPGLPNVWAKEANAAPIRVRVVVEAIEKEPAEAVAPNEKAKN